MYVKCKYNVYTLVKLKKKNNKFIKNSWNFL